MIGNPVDTGVINATSIDVLDNLIYLDGSVGPAADKAIFIGFGS